MDTVRIDTVWMDTVRIDTVRIDTAQPVVLREERRPFCGCSVRMSPNGGRVWGTACLIFGDRKMNS